jgi:hypothetical protein
MHMKGLGNSFLPVTLMLSAWPGQVRELESLRHQLEEEVDIPQLQPLRDECEQLDNLIQGVMDLQASAS